MPITCPRHCHISQLRLTCFFRKRRWEWEILCLSSIAVIASCISTSNKSISSYWFLFKSQERHTWSSFGSSGSKDRVSFLTIANSIDISNGLKIAGFTVPKSHKTIREKVCFFANDVKTEYIHQINMAKISSKYLSISLDEWTSLRNKRYLSLIVHSADTYWNLGLIYIPGSTNAIQLTKMILMKLKEFELDCTDMCALMSDGAPINKSIAWEANLDWLPCFAHGVQLAVKSVLYDDVEHSDISSSEDDEIGLEAFGDNVFVPKVPTLRIPYYHQ